MALFFRKQPSGVKATFKISGMHCTSCCLNIDGGLEEVTGVTSAATSYAKSQTVVWFDPKITSLDQITSEIENLGYVVENVASAA